MFNYIIIILIMCGGYILFSYLIELWNKEKQYSDNIINHYTNYKSYEELIEENNKILHEMREHLIQIDLIISKNKIDEKN